jgi:DNA repair protein SbcD/Mre11
MKIVHFSDTHLGFQAFDHVNDAGVNTREQDVYDAFERVIDRILEIKPGLAIHSGDLFHRPSPSNRALTFGLEQLRRLSQAAIPLVVIAGNHETPKTIYNSPILRALRALDGIHPMFGDAWELEQFGTIAVHGVPHINDNRLLQQQLERLTPVEGKYNILLLHTSLGRKYLMEEYGEQVFPESFEAKLQGFQYIALGHWHGCQPVNLHPNAWYSGSTERFSDAEAGSEKGFLILDIQPDNSCSVVFEAIKTRPWLVWERKNCHEVSVGELTSELQFFQNQNRLDEAIVSLNFIDIRPEQAMELSNMHLRQLFPTCFQLIPKRKTLTDKAFVHDLEASQFDSLDQIFGDYLRSKYPDNPVLANQLIAKAGKYFAGG